MFSPNDNLTKGKMAVSIFVLVIKRSKQASVLRARVVDISLCYVGTLALFGAPSVLFVIP